MFEGPFDEGMIRVACEVGVVEIRVLDLRDYTDDPHRSIDDYPYGGGPGMILKVDPVARGLETLPAPLGDRREIVLLTPQGEPCRQSLVRRLVVAGDVVLLMGRYKGLDERIRSFVTREVSVGDFILSGGEPAAIVLTDAMVRLVPGVLGDVESAWSDSFEDEILDSGYYTRPEDFRGMRVPRVLLSGNHGMIRRARREDALLRTLRRRPDLLDRADLSPEERAFLRAHGWPESGQNAGETKAEGKTTLVDGPRRHAPVGTAGDRTTDEGMGAGRPRKSRTTRAMRKKNHGRAEER